MKRVPTLILASASPRRRELLDLLGVPFRVIPSSAEEAPRPGEAPRSYARRAALDKGEETAARHPSSWIVSADTIVTADRAILGKPADREEAFRMLSFLAGREHRVITAVCLIRKDRGYRDEATVATRVRFRALSRLEIEGYLRAGEWDDKAGAYAAQGAGMLLIERIAGSFSNVVGLPVTQTLALLAKAGVVEASPRGREWYRLGGEAG